MRYDKRKNRWVVRVRMPDGRRPSKFFRSKETARDFERKQEEIRERIAVGLSIPLEEVLCIDAAYKFLQWREKTTIAATFEAEPPRIARCLRFFGPELPLDAVQPYMVEELAVDLLQTNSPATVNKYLSLLNQFFKFAKKRHWVRINPVEDVKRYSETKQTRPHAYWDEPQHMERFLEEAQKRGPMIYALMNFFAFTAARSCEIQGAHWGDWEGETFRLQRIFDKTTATIQDRLKGQKEGGKHVIPIPDRLREALIVWRSRSCFNGASQPIFCNGRGGYLRHNWIYRLIRELCVAAEVPVIGPHGIRHSATRFLGMLGATGREQQTLLGHTSLKTTERYARQDAKHLARRQSELGWGALPEGQERMLTLVQGGEEDGDG